MEENVNEYQGEAMGLLNKETTRRLRERLKELLLYEFFGVFTLLISIGSFALFTETLMIDPLVANVFSWVLAVAFAYVTNRNWVFKKTATGAGDVIHETMRFVSGRLSTLIIEELIILVCVTWLGMDNMIVKVVAQIVVILLNYCISRFWVFR